MMITGYGPLKTFLGKRKLEPVRSKFRYINDIFKRIFQGEGPRATALSQIRSNIVWMEKYIDDIDGWLNAKIPSED